MLVLGRDPLGVAAMAGIEHQRPTEAATPGDLAIGVLQVPAPSGVDTGGMQQVPGAGELRLAALEESVESRVVALRSFEEFFAQEQERLLRALAVITGSRREAEDLAQSAFVKVFERWDRVALMDEPAGYLHRTAMNLFRNQYRRARVAISRAVGVGHEQDVFKSVDDRDVATRALAALTTRQRAALVLTEAFGYSGEETGRLLGIKASTVFALTYQARAALRANAEAHDES